MRVEPGRSPHVKYGPGVAVVLEPDEVAVAIWAYLVAHGVHIEGARTTSPILFDDPHVATCGMRVSVDPSGSVIADGVSHLGRTGLPEETEPDDGPCMLCDCDGCQMCSTGSVRCECGR